MPAWWVAKPKGSSSFSAASLHESASACRISFDADESCGHQQSV